MCTYEFGSFKNVLKAPPPDLRNNVLTQFVLVGSEIFHANGPGRRSLPYFMSRLGGIRLFFYKNQENRAEAQCSYFKFFLKFHPNPISL